MARVIVRPIPIKNRPTPIQRRCELMIKIKAPTQMQADVRIRENFLPYLSKQVVNIKYPIRPPK